MPKVRLNDVDIYYEEHGQGQPMVFLSETACDGEVWKINQVPQFSRDHRVIIHDYRGTGQSSKPSIDYTTRMFADDVVALMGCLDERCNRRWALHGRQGGAIVGARSSEEGPQACLGIHWRALSANQRTAVKNLPTDDRMGL